MKYAILGCMEKEGGLKEPLIHDLETQSSIMKKKKISIIVFSVVTLLGLGTGYLFAGMKNTQVPASGDSNNPSSTNEAVEKGQIVGSQDEASFKDSAEGVLKLGGIDGEGTYHLERPGGESKNVYLTSSVVDLSLYENRKVKVWGQTFAGQKAAWLMDVGRLQVLE